MYEPFFSILYFGVRESPKVDLNSIHNIGNSVFNNSRGDYL